MQVGRFRGRSRPMMTEGRFGLRKMRLERTGDRGDAAVPREVPLAAAVEVPVPGMLPRTELKAARTSRTAPAIADPLLQPLHA